MVPYEIDEIDDEASHLRPVVRLANLLFRTCLEGGFTEFRLVTASGTAEVEREGAWTPMMKFPAMVYAALVGQCKTIARIEQDAALGVPLTLQLRWRGQNVRATMTQRGTDGRVEEVWFQLEPDVSPTG